MRKTILLFLLFISCGLSAQFSFTNSNQLLSNTDVHSGLTMAVADMNNDRLDDLVRLDQGNVITIDYQNLDGSFTQSVFNTVTAIDEQEWTLSVADIDNNGYRDLMCGGRYNEMKIYFANEDGTDYEEYFLPGDNLFAQGSNLIDIDADGFLDAFVCHDDGESRIWLNMKDKSFTTADYMIDMTTTPSSDNSGNYGSIWTDFDNDGDIDLYIAKCRQFINDPTDPRRINVLFVNDGNGNFSEEAAEYGLKIADQSWTADFEDIDNDGDMDAFITSHNSPPQLMENDGTGHFTEISPFVSGLESSDFAIQAKMADFDNDGFVDLLVSGGEERVYHNNGDKTFTLMNNVLENTDLYSFALGDLNHDGFIDINGGYGSVYTDPTTRDDILWMNEGNDNNWIAFNLEGTESNRDAVGTRVKITGSWGVQIREVRSGESYGISNSLAVHFGLGDAVIVNEVEILWPSGENQIISDLSPNQYIYVQEQGCIAGGINMQIDGELTFCTGGSVTLSVPDGFDGYLWSNGEMSNSIDVTTSGGYQVTVENGDCSSTSNIVQVVVDPDETPQIDQGIDAVVCPGQGFFLSATAVNPNSTISWSNGEVGNEIDIIIPNTYIASVEGDCGTFSSEPFVLENYVVELMTQNDTVDAGQTALLVSTGLEPKWFDTSSGGTLLGEGNTFITDPIDATTNFYVESEVEFGAPTEKVGIESNVGLNGFFFNGGSGGLLLEIIDSVMLTEFTVYANSSGSRTIAFFDNSTGMFIGQMFIDCVVGENVITADFKLFESQSITMRVSNNSDLYSLIDLNDFDFPYESTEGSVILLGGISQRYDFFFNMKFKKLGGAICQSDRQLVRAVLEGSVSTNENLNNAFELTLSPNPTSNYVSVQTSLDNLNGMTLQVFNSIGEKMPTVLNNAKIDLTPLASGVYYLQFANELGTVSKKIVKQ